MYNLIHAAFIHPYIGKTDKKLRDRANISTEWVGKQGTSQQAYNPCVIICGGKRPNAVYREVAKVIHKLSCIFGLPVILSRHKKKLGYDKYHVRNMIVYSIKINDDRRTLLNGWEVSITAVFGYQYK